MKGSMHPMETMKGLIRRRLLLNFRVDPALLQPQLPASFRPRLVGGYAMLGVCAIRLERLRPDWSPIGFSSENAAHRVAVEWTGEDPASAQPRVGVYILRRDTGSL